jgi:FMN reductase
VNGFAGDAGGVAMTVLAANCRPDSRTLGVARHAAAALRAGLVAERVFVAEPDVVDLGALGPSVPLRLTGAAADHHPLGAALALISRPGLLVVASPTFKGSYAGILKLVLDMLPLPGLPGSTVAVAVTTAGWPQHRTVAGAHLRSLLAELGAQVPARGLAVLESELAELDLMVRPWVTEVAPVVAAVVRRLVGDGSPQPLSASYPAP